MIAARGLRGEATRDHHCEKAWRPTPIAKRRLRERLSSDTFSLATRWSDNDAYGHLNNVVYYALFDSAVNAILIEAGLLDPASSPIIGLVVESSCRFYASLTYPEPAEVGVAVEHLGRSSVRYRLAVFKEGALEAAAAGGYTHVYVERATNRPVADP